MKKLPATLAPLGLVALALAPLARIPGAQATEPAVYNQPVNLQALFAAPGDVTMTDRIEEEQALNFYRNLELDNFQVSGFMASRKPEAAPESATDYRTYLGLGYHDTIAESVQLSGRAFYGAGSYDGDNSYVNPKSGGLPDEVRADGRPVGEWLGSAWQLNARLFERQTLEAGIDYRQPVAMHLFDERHVFGSLASTAEPADARSSVGLRAGSTVALAGDLAVQAHVRRNSDASGYDIGMTNQPKAGIKTGVSYAVQELADPLAAGSSATLQRRLTKVNVSVPLLSERFSTGFEIEHDDVESSLVPDGHRDFVIGNLTLASGRIVRNTSVSLGVQNIFDTRGVNDGGTAIPFMPSDGRSVRLDLKRTF